MRDVVDRTTLGVKSYEQQFKDYPYKGAPERTVWVAPWGSSTQSIAASRIRRGRADLVLSDGVRPTPYYGWEIKQRSHSVDIYNYVSAIQRYHISGPQVVMPEAIPYVTTQAPYLPLIPQDMVDEANTRHANKIKNTTLDLSETIAESSDIPTLVRSLIQVVKALLSAARGKWANAGKHLGLHKPLEAAADGYLAWNLGFRPMISTIESLAQLTEERLSRMNQTVSSTLVRNVPIHRNTGSSGSMQLIVANQDTFTVTEADTRALARVGLGSRFDALAGLWAAVPYSFVVDYVFGIQAWLTSLSAFRGLTWSHGFTNKIVRTKSPLRTEREIEYNDFVPPNLLEAKEKTAYATSSVFTFQRIPRGGFADPGLFVRFGLNPNQLGILSALTYKLSR